MLDNRNYDDAIDFYEELLTNDLFVNDYHPYLKLANAYHRARYFDKEVELKFYQNSQDPNF